MPPNTIDLSEFKPDLEGISLDNRWKNARAGSVSVAKTSSTETKPLQVVEHEIGEAALASKHKREQENATFRVMLTIGIVLLLVLLAIIFIPLIPSLANAFTAEQHAGAITALVSLFTGVVGYFTGSQIK